jgi:release factor glutamine methyltransferase
VKTADVISQIANRLAAAGIEDSRREARIILAHALGTDAAGLLALSEIEPAIAEPLVARRAAREPLAYIFGQREFWGLDLCTSSATLIPRPDTETLIEAALAIFRHRPLVLRILDLGTGTGCLLLAALHEFPGAFGIGVDISPQASALARLNAESLGLAGRAAFIAGNWADAISEKFDLILSNPPYITTADLAGLMPEVQIYEPLTALDGGADGLAAYRAIILDLPRLLAANGAAILELGAGQAPEVAKIAETAGFNTQTRADLANIPRALIIRP